MWIGLTGTPGTGKTTAADILRKTYHYQVIDLTNYAAQTDCITGQDTEHDTKLVDIDCLNHAIITTFDPDDTIIFEGHFAHLLPLNTIIILRCHPTTLRKRLEPKHYTQAKINENIEAETLDIILCEAVEIHPEDHLYEIDTTTKNPDKITAIIHTLITTDFPKDTPYKIGAIDWSEELLKDK